MATTCIPPANPPCTPSGESSKTMHRLGGTPASSAAFRKMSGAGFPWTTSSAVTIPSKRLIISLWGAILAPIRERGVEVAMNCFTPFSAKKRVSESAPLSFLNEGEAAVIPFTYWSAYMKLQANPYKILRINQTFQICNLHHALYPQFGGKADNGAMVFAIGDCREDWFTIQSPDCLTSHFP